MFGLYPKGLEKSMNRFYKELFIASGIFFLTLILFFPKHVFNDYVFYASDNFNLMTPTRVFLANELKEGRFPLWNPLILSGTPFFADIAYGLLHPSNLFFLILSPFRALTASIFVDFAIAYFGMYMLLRRLTGFFLPAFAGALLFTYSGSMAVYTDNLSSLHSAVWTPWVLWAWIGFFQNKTYKTFIFSVITLSLQIISGHPQMTYYTVLACAAYSLYIVDMRIVKKIFLILLIIGASIGVTAVQLVPFVELASHAVRTKLGTDFATSGSLNPFYVIHFILPWLVGVKTWGTQMISDGNIFGYIGIIPFFLLASITKWYRMKKYFFIMAIVSLLVSFGNYTPVYWIFYWLVPGFSKFRIPQQILLLYTISMCVLSAYGLQSVITTGIAKKMKAILLYAGIVLLGVGGLWLYFRSIIADAIISFISPYASVKLIQKLALPRHVVVEGISMHVILNIILISVLLLSFYLWDRYLGKNKKMHVVLLCIIYIDLLVIVSPSIHSLPNEQVEGFLALGKKTVASFRDFDPLRHKIYVPVPSHQAPRPKAYGLANDYEEELWQAVILRPDVNMYFGIPTVEGYTSMVYAPYQQYFDPNTYLPTGIFIPADRTETLVASVSAKFIIGKNATIVPVEHTRERIFLNDRKGNILRASPLILSSASDSIDITTEIDVPSTLVFLDVNYPGWVATVDGKQSRIRPYEKIFKSLDLSSGKHTIQFIFRPKSVVVGLIISVGTIFLLGFFYLLSYKKNGRTNRWFQSVFKW